MHNFGAAGHAEMMRLLVQLALLLTTARLLSELALRLKQPSLVGELCAGILLGPSFLSTLAPSFAPYVMPKSEVNGHLLGVLTLLGSMMLLLNAGWETDIRVIRRHWKTALAVSSSGIVVPFAGGFALGMGLPEFLVGDQHQRLLFSLFMGTALSISSISVISKVLLDLNLLRRDIGQTILASGTIDDTAGWILVSLVVSMARGQGVSWVSAGESIAHLGLFLGLNFTLGRWLVRRLLALVQDELQDPDRLLSLIFVLMFGWAAAAQALDLEPVVGTFFLGNLLASRRRIPREVRVKMNSLGRGVFIPLFFAAAGLRVELIPLLHPRLFAYGLLFLVVASLGKIVGTYVGARLLSRTDHWSALALGAGMNARGSMEIIVATLGLSLGIIAPGMFSIVVVMAMMMSLATPSALRFLVARIPPNELERQRLSREAWAANSPVAEIARVLLPVRRRSEGPEFYRYEVDLLQRLAKERIAVTLLQVTQETPDPEADTFVQGVRALFERTRDVTVKVVSADQVTPAVLREAEKDYDLLLLSVSGPYPPLDGETDYLCRNATCLTLLVRRDGAAPSSSAAGAGRSLLVPTDGRAESVRAAEIAVLMASPEDEIQFLHVVQRGELGGEPNPHLEAAYQILEHLRELAKAHEVRCSAELRWGDVAEDTILEVARRRGVDLLVIGTQLRSAQNRAFWGAGVETLLAQSPCSVLLLQVS